MKDLSKTFNVHVTPHAKQNKIVKSDDGVLRVYTNVAPENGRANAAVVEIVSEYLQIPKSRLKIIRGLTGRDKVITID